MKKDLLSRYGGPVPRYTSYPTAPHFHSGVRSSDYQSWLRQLTPGQSLSLYLHVPYCREMCWYCGCQTKITRRDKPVADYAKSLAREIEMVADNLGSRFSVSHIHWGGGSPTLLASDTFMALMARLNTQFSIDHDAEIAVEIDPRTLTIEKAGKLAQAGVTRASLGIQDFNPHVQMAINRFQSFTQTRAVVAALRAAGINSISLDLMYGLPRQTVDDALRTVEMTMDFDADRYSVFGYAHVPWMKSHQKKINEADIPAAGVRVRQARAISRRLQELGYGAIGLDHYAKADDPMAKAYRTGELHRNFQGYTTDAAPALIGFGASAIGRLPQGYIQNESSVRSYRAAVASNTFAVARGLELTPDDRYRGTLIERLMCDYRVDLWGPGAAPHGRKDDFASELPRLKQMQADGLLTLSDGHLAITEQGRPFVRSVCAVFDQYLESGSGRHSLAV